MSSEALGAVTGDAETDQGLVPKLRFPEFRDAGAWKERPLASLAHINPPNSGLPASFAYIDLGVVEGGSLTAINVIERDGAPSRAQRVLQSGDVLFQMVRPYQRNNLLFDRDDADFVASTGYAQLRSKGPAEFLYQIIHTDYFVDRVIGKCTGSNYPAINSSDLAAIFVVMPEHAEQQKIADCLSSLDDLIAAEGERMTALHDQKSGLMQNLFPAPGETTPRLRFPEFQDAGEWKETTIGEVGSFYYGKSAPKWSLEGDAPTSCVRYGELYTKFGPLITETFSRTNIPPENLRFSKGGEILVPRVGEKPDDFGRNCSLLTLSGIAIGEMISVFETDQNALFYTFYFRHLYREFAKVVEGQNVKNLYYTELEPLTIYRPSVPEQARIAECLLSLEQLAEVSRIKIAKLRHHKLGLMQQLFASPAEVSA